MCRHLKLLPINRISDSFLINIQNQSETHHYTKYVQSIIITIIINGKKYTCGICCDWKKKVPSTIFHPVNVTNEATTSIYVSTKNDRLCAYPAECQEVQFIDMSE